MYFQKRNEVSNQIPKPFVFKPIGKWEESDGKWSSFYVNVGADDKGENGQNFRVLISTSSGTTILPSTSNWCTTDSCAESRGLEIFRNSRSRGFDQKVGVYSDNGRLFIPDPYGMNGSQFEPGRPQADYGFATVGLGQTSPQSLVLPNQWIGATSSKDYFMGSFGLSAGVSTTRGSSSMAFLYSFESRNKTPSLSYGFTAGAYYRDGNRGRHANLVFGGYDTTRFRQSNTYPSIPLTGSDLVVNVQSVDYTPISNLRSDTVSWTGGTPNPMFFAAIDSTFPYLWLPKEVCDQFERTYGLTWNERGNYYTVNETAHKYNLVQGGTVKFVLGKDQSNTQATSSIELPYQAFSQPINPELFPNTNATRYFAIKRSTNGKYVLGRTFLQEAYLIVDYENSNFTVSPAAWPETMPSETIVPIISKKWDYLKHSQEQSSGGLSGGAIAGIVVGILVVFGIIGLVAFFFWKRRRTHNYPSEVHEKDSENGTTQISETVKYGHLSELYSEPPQSPDPSVGGYYGEGKDRVPFPAEMESPPVEMYSPPLENATLARDDPADYFIAGTMVRRRGATRESSGPNTPGTPGVPELAGDDGQFTVDGQHFDPVVSPIQSPVHSRGPSDTSLATNIDEIISGSAAPIDRRPSPSPARDSIPEESHEAGVEGRPARDSSPGISPEPSRGLDRRPSHTRGLSDITIQSDSTGISNPTPEEVENWGKNDNGESRRPLSG